MIGKIGSWPMGWIVVEGGGAISAPSKYRSETINVWLSPISAQEPNVNRESTASGLYERKSHVIFSSSSWFAVVGAGCECCGGRGVLGKQEWSNCE